MSADCFSFWGTLKGPHISKSALQGNNFTQK